MSNDAIRQIDFGLKLVLPILALGAGALGVRGDTWDKERKHPTSVGYFTMAVALSVALVSVLTSGLDQRASSIDREEGRNEEVSRLRPILDNQETATKALKEANAALR